MNPGRHHRRVGGIGIKQVLGLVGAAFLSCIVLALLMLEALFIFGMPFSALVLRYVIGN